jgi:hypothetical protein
VITSHTSAKKPILKIGDQMKAKIFVVIFLSLMSVTSLSHAYDQKNCMAGIEIALNLSTPLDESNTRFMKDMAVLLNSGVITDNDVAAHLSAQVNLASTAITNAGVISTLKQAGTFKQPKLVDKLVDGQFQNLFVTVTSAKSSFVKWTGAMKNQSLKDQALASSQQLEKIHNAIRTCEK